MKEKPPAVARVRKSWPRKPRSGRTREETLFAQKLRREVSKTEKRLWPALLDGQLGASFRRQHVIDGLFPDYCCVELHLIVEIDGPQHDPVRDANRDVRFKALGYDVLRFGVQEIDRNLDGVISTIYDAVQLRLIAATAPD
jgi:very-short-patch-repair endonuclease